MTIHNDNKPSPLTLDYIRNAISYDPNTGIITSKEDGSNVGYNWSSSKNGNKYVVCFVLYTTPNKAIRAHHIAWYLTYGEWPGMIIDHIDGNGLNNKIDNLRLATTIQNSYNKKKKPTFNGKQTTSQYKGVSKVYNRNGDIRWRATISSNSKKESLGTFRTELEAAAAYNTKAQELHGEFASLNNITVV